MTYNKGMLSEKQIEEIELKAIEIRKDIIKMLLAAGSGHPAGALGMAEVFSTLYFSGCLNWNPDEPFAENRDRVLLSAGHICPVWYATLAHTGAFSHQELTTLRKLGSRLQGHPHYKSLPGIENTSGPLGQGLSQAIGQAMAMRMDKKGVKVYCIMSDGEFQEGQTYEGLMFAGNNKLHNLILMIDRNRIQISGKTEDIMPLEPLMGKLKAFNWEAIEVDGHNVSEIYKEIEKAKARTNGPTALVMRTIPGKGIDFMEGKPAWHGKAPNEELGAKAISELKSLWGRLVD